MLRGLSSNVFLDDIFFFTFVKTFFLDLALAGCRYNLKQVHITHFLVALIVEGLLVALRIGKDVFVVCEELRTHLFVFDVFAIFAEQ